MLKYNQILKEKQTLSKKINEQRLLKSFKKVYSLLLEQYQISKINKLDNPTKQAFLSELNIYWDKDKGLTKKGSKFIKTNKSILNENSTIHQKSKYLKENIINILEQTINNYDVKDKIYKVLDEMYKSTNANDIDDVLPAKKISNIVSESLANVIGKVTSEIFFEITPDTTINENKK